VITSEWLSEHGAAVIVEGDLDLDTAPLLAAEIERQIADGHYHLVVDLTSTSFLDSTSMGTLITAVRPLQGVPEAAVVLAGASGVVERALLTSGIGQLFTMFATRDEAAARAVDASSPLCDGWRRVRRRG
jgi:anti-anti-sigma factor